VILRVLSPGRSAGPKPDAGVLWLEPTPDLGGAWTEMRGGAEVIRFGFPAASRSRWFQILSDPGRRHHVLTLALERIVYARGVSVVEYDSEELVPMLRRALRLHAGVQLRRAEAVE